MTTENTTADVTIFVPCYNYGRYLHECLSSIFAQTFEHRILEVLIIDDCSTDETAEVVSRFCDKRIKYIRHEQNRGLCKTLEHGITIARGKYLARIDADDSYLPNFLEELVPILDEHEDVGLAYGECTETEEDRSPRGGHCYAHYLHKASEFKGDAFTQELSVCSIGACTVIGRTEAWRIGVPFPYWFTYQSPSDWFLNAVVAKHYDVYFKPVIVALYRNHTCNIHNKPTNPHLREQTLVGTLDFLLREDPRVDTEHNACRRMYADLWKDLGNVFFQENLPEDARRCYRNVLKYRPSYLFRTRIVQHFIASYIPREMYDLFKKGVKKTLKLAWN